MGIVPVVGAVIEVVHRKRLLEDHRVGALRNGHEDGIDVAHVVAADDVGAVGQAAADACRWPKRSSSAAELMAPQETTTISAE